MKVQFQKLHPNAVLPKQGSELAGGWDVVATEVIEKEPGFVVCKLGFALQPPTNYKVTLVPRSSLTGTQWVVQNSPGLGDPDYRGEYQVRFRAFPVDFHYTPGNGVYGPGGYGPKTRLIYPEFPYKPGERVAQMYIEEIIPIEFEEVDELSVTERGVGGFGHTGK